MLIKGIEVKNPSGLLRTLRGVVGASRNDIEKVSGISRETIKGIEDGKSQGSSETWDKIVSVIHPDDIEIANNLQGAATDLLAEIEEDIAMGNDREVRLYYIISGVGKLWVCDLDYFDDSDEGEPFIVTTLSKAKGLLMNQVKELGS